MDRSEEEIKTSVTINATQEKIWDVISDSDNEPKFWKGTKEVRNISKDGNQISREITIAFRDQKCLQDVTIVPKETIKAIFTKGGIVGEKILTLKEMENACELEAVWDVKLTGKMGMFTGIIKKNIKRRTEQELQEIKESTCKILLQIHDVLIFEIHKDDIKNYSQIIKEEMSSVKNSDLHSFSIPLLVDVNVGNNWGELH